MSLPMKIISVVLLVLGLFGGYAAWVISDQNGFFDMNLSHMEKGSLPGSPDASLIREYTGLCPLDKFLQLYTVFYWPLFYGHPPGPSLLALELWAGVATMWALITMETSRTHLLTRALFKMGIFGIVLTIIGPSIVISIYCAWDLFSLSKISSRSPPPTSPHLRRHLIGVLLVIYSLLVVLMSLSSPTFVSHGFKQVMIAVFQGWPLYVSVILWATNLTCKCVEFPTSNMSFYLWIMGFATAAHLVPLTISIFSPKTHEMRPGYVYLPVPPWSDKPILSLEDGLHRFIQWDNLIGSCAGLLWAMGKYIHHCKQRGSTLNYRRLVPEAVLLAIIMSPYGAASWYLSRRDSLDSPLLVGNKKKISG